MPTTEEKIADINKQPCNSGEVSQSITNITNVLNELNGNGSILARCVLTSNGSSCAPVDLAVSSFVPFVTDFAATGIAVPATAKNLLNRPFLPLIGQTAYIAYEPASQLWEVVNASYQLRQTVVDVALRPRGFDFTVETHGVPTCDDDGVVPLDFSTAAVSVVQDLSKAAGGPIEWNDVELEVWDVGGTTPQSISTTLATMIREFHKDGCSIKYRDTEVEVFAKDEHASESTALTFDEVVNLIGDLNQNSDGNIVAYYVPIHVPCSGTPFEEVILYVERCASGSGG